jgi:hypothetical protein
MRSAPERRMFEFFWPGADAKMLLTETATLSLWEF